MKSNEWQPSQWAGIGTYGFLRNRVAAAAQDPGQSHPEGLFTPHTHRPKGVFTPTPTARRASSHPHPRPKGVFTPTLTPTPSSQGDKLSTHTSHPRPKGVFTPHTQHPLGVTALGPVDPYCCCCYACTKPSSSSILLSPGRARPKQLHHSSGMPASRQERPLGTCSRVKSYAVFPGPCLVLGDNQPSIVLCKSL